MKLTTKIKLSVMAMGMAALLSTGAQAQITWSTPQAVTAGDDGTLDVSTAGTEVDGIRAYTDDLGALSAFPTLTLNNGVVFNGTSSSSGAIQDSSGDIVANMGGPLYTPGPGTTVGNYEALLGSVSYTVGSGTIDFNNLTVNDQYQVQVWVSQVNAPDNGLNLAGTTPVGLAASLPAVGGPNGTFVIGTFTATSTSFVEDYSNLAYAGESPDLNGNTPDYSNAAILNAIQLRDLTPAEIPEPGTMALMGMAGVAFLIIRRRRAA